ncbi:MAG: hypothetical protein QM657_07150 [Lacrimispora sp.]|uniref:hypothetical protein n=1 Tax=Lacrimispora sp. TaxID=2719234 RepID=UPI0039E5DF19
MTEVPDNDNKQLPYVFQPNGAIYPSQAVDPSYGYNGFGITQKTLESIIKSNHEAHNAIEKRRELNNLDFENFKKKQDYKEGNRIWNNLSPTNIYWNARGKIQFEVYSLNGAINLEELCNIQKSEVEVIMYKPMTGASLENSMYVVTYHIGENTYQISIPEEECGRGKLLSKMRRNGVTFYISQRKLNEISITFEAFILKEAKVKLIPMAYGWIIYKKRWYFISENDLIWREVKNGKYTHEDGYIIFPGA